MKLEHIENNLQDIKAHYHQHFEYFINEKADKSDIDSAEKNLNVQIPKQVKLFYEFCNGLTTKNPNLEIIKISDWEKVDENLIHLATFNKVNKVFFDTMKLNVANQWSIVNPKKEYTLTYTMSSFWSNKIWHWLRFKRIIWEDKYWE